MGKHTVTIKDVAALANVSVATVSNVIRGKDGLYSTETAQRVWDTINSCGYQPNHAARSLVLRRTNTLGIAIEEETHGVFTRNAYISGILDGFLEHALVEDYQIRIVLTKDSTINQIRSTCEDGSMDGILVIAPTLIGDFIPWLKTSHLPSVVVGSIPPDLPCPCIDVDDVQAVYRLTKLLIDNGHRNIGLIKAQPALWTSRRREQGYKMALDEAGIKWKSAWIQHGTESTLNAGRTCALDIIREAPELTAIVCANDYVALGAMESLREQKIRVCEDISIVGFDNIEAGRWSSPNLTTVSQPLHDMGRKATEMLIDQIRTGIKEAITTLYPGTLIQRQSVKKIA
ncbi:MAG: LacI family DNA-binding transcriptional regulator [Armatimonadota bacterium]|nr:LacI family transcriptional regulator [bacterium]